MGIPFRLSAKERPESWIGRLYRRLRAMPFLRSGIYDLHPPGKLLTHTVLFDKEGFLDGVHGPLRSRIRARDKILYQPGGFGKLVRAYVGGEIGLEDTVAILRGARFDTMKHLRYMRDRETNKTRRGAIQKLIDSF